jgi:hypothetical protein
MRKILGIINLFLVVNSSENNHIKNILKEKIHRDFNDKSPFMKEFMEKFMKMENSPLLMEAFEEVKTEREAAGEIVKNENNNTIKIKPISEFINKNK